MVMKSHLVLVILHNFDDNIGIPFTFLKKNKNIHLQTVPPSMSGINSASNDIDGGTGCNFIYFIDKMQLRPIHRLCWVFFSYYSRCRL